MSENDILIYNFSQKSIYISYENKTKHYALKNSFDDLYFYLTRSYACRHVNVSIINCYLDINVCKHDTMSAIYI